MNEEPAFDFFANTLQEACLALPIIKHLMIKTARIHIPHKYADSDFTQQFRKQIMIHYLDAHDYYRRQRAPGCFYTTLVTPAEALFIISCPGYLHSFQKELELRDCYAPFAAITRRHSDTELECCRMIQCYLTYLAEYLSHQNSVSQLLDERKGNCDACASFADFFRRLMGLDGRVYLTETHAFNMIRIADRNEFFDFCFELPTTWTKEPFHQNTVTDPEHFKAHHPYEIAADQVDQLMEEIKLDRAFRQAAITLRTGRTDMRIGNLTVRMREPLVRLEGGKRILDLRTLCAALGGTFVRKDRTSIFACYRGECNLLQPDYLTGMQPGFARAECLREMKGIFLES